MNISGLYNLAKINNIDVLFIKNKKDGCAIKLPNGEMVVGLSTYIIYNECRERIILAEELAHCVTNSFYYLQNKLSKIYLSNVAKAETTAHNKQIELLVDIEELKKQLLYTTDIYDLADLFDISVELMTQSIEYYKCKNLI